jgi:hypothetical protein
VLTKSIRPFFRLILIVEFSLKRLHGTRSGLVVGSVDVTALARGVISTLSLVASVTTPLEVYACEGADIIFFTVAAVVRPD